MTAADSYSIYASLSFIVALLIVYVLLGRWKSPRYLDSHTSGAEFRAGSLYAKTAAELGPPSPNYKLGIMVLYDDLLQMTRRKERGVCSLKDEWRGDPLDEVKRSLDSLASKYARCMEKKEVTLKQFHKFQHDYSLAKDQLVG